MGFYFVEFSILEKVSSILYSKVISASLYQIPNNKDEMLMNSGDC